jgi:cytoskeleton protein RodZ
LTEEGKPTVGQYLRRERERQKKSLESVAQATRITLRNLEALEADNFQAFSAPVFIRGFFFTLFTR